MAHHWTWAAPLFGFMGLFLLLRHEGSAEPTPPGVVSRRAPAPRRGPSLRGLRRPAGTQAETDRAPGSAVPKTEDGTWMLEGRVLDFKGNPVEGVPIVVAAEGVVARSGAEGRFAWQTDRVEVSVTPGTGWDGAAKEASREHPGVQVRADRLLEVRGRVLDTAGTPVAGIRVYGHCVVVVDEESHGRYLEAGPTDRAGCFSLDVPESAIAVSLRVHAGKTYDSVDPRFPFEREVTLHLRKEREIRIHVFDAEGRSIPVPGSGWYEVRPVDPARSNEPPSEDDWDVQYVAGPGPHLVTFYPADDDLACSAPVEVRAPDKDVRLVCPPAVSIQGRVLDAGESKFKVFWIPSPEANGYRREVECTPTDAEGNFALHGLAPGPGRLFVRSRDDDRCGFLEGVEAPLDGVGIPLEEGGVITGRVVDPKPSPDCKKHVNWLLVGALGDGLRTVSRVKDDGTFRLHGLPPGDYALSWKWVAWARDSRWAPFRHAEHVRPDGSPLLLSRRDG